MSFLAFFFGQEGEACHSALLKVEIHRPPHRLLGLVVVDVIKISCHLLKFSYLFPGMLFLGISLDKG